MRKPIITGAAALCLSLGACNTAGGNKIDIAAIVTQVQDAAIAACAFEPTAQTIADIIAADNATVQSAANIAGMICKAVTVAPKRMRAGTTRATTSLTINGKQILVAGEFVR